jgi:hypothetical protein
VGEEVATQRDGPLITLRRQLLRERAALALLPVYEHGDHHLVGSLVLRLDHRRDGFSLHQRFGVVEQAFQLVETLVIAELP